MRGIRGEREGCTGVSMAMGVLWHAGRAAEFLQGERISVNGRRAQAHQHGTGRAVALMESRALVLAWTLSCHWTRRIAPRPCSACQ